MEIFLCRTCCFQISKQRSSKRWFTKVEVGGFPFFADRLIIIISGMLTIFVAIFLR